MKRMSVICGLSLVVIAAQAQDKGHECLIEPWQRVEVRSPVEALIESVPVDRGSRVKKGQILVTLDSGVERAALASARYRAVVEGAVRSAESRVAYARGKHQRREELKKQNFISGQDRDDALAEMQIAEAGLTEAREDLAAAALEARRLEELLRQRKLKSPFAGVVTERLQHPGELAQTGETARAILKLAQTDHLRVEVVLPAALYGTIKVRQNADVDAETPLKGRYKAVVQVVDGVVDSASGTFGVRLDLPNPNGDIPPGIKCRVRFNPPGAGQAASRG